MQNMDIGQLEQKAEQAASLLSSMAHTKRLMVLCKLLQGECAVGELAEAVGLSQSALSQHLAKMRASELVKTRRSAQTIYYSLASAEVEAVLQTLYQLYCAPELEAAEENQDHTATV
ncbi:MULTISPECIES: ArsR/SmtB family transcription factor [Pseudovibrio]|uniref:ArsR/SmtB family transcription factor n=1 Tax=Stappiaceae TaxID=2821832 RepID=UPI0023662235|nr:MULTISPECIES: metalloregulator ArsR/SmtB family transcription factor [Pseudovibrio]MDD7909591.1 metalloregulator ArsR/SmtB family transcription factor [Pseudovibrio exalbescens]MDX5595056.1 metalloregulator ArsR/SmtB family transcription factor [Pseudovibrio sp. SPO723]